jgi:hypothetical protein
MDCIHEEVSSRAYPNKPWYDANGKYQQELYDAYYQPVMKEFRKDGCKALTVYAAHCSKAPDKNATQITSMLFDVLGDDVDGIASELEDAEFLGYI